MQRIERCVARPLISLLVNITWTQILHSGVWIHHMNTDCKHVNMLFPTEYIILINAKKRNGRCA